jgi:hypothetical protein
MRVSSPSQAILAVLAFGLSLASAVPAARGSEGVDRLVEALALPAMVDILREEGLAYGSDLEASMFPGEGGDAWAETVSGIYASDLNLDLVRDRLEEDLATDPAAVADMVGFFDSETGQKAIALELSARRALLDQAVEEAAQVGLDEARASGDPRLVMVEEFVAVNDLIESNVTGGLNASLAFYMGLREGGGLETDLPERDLLAQVWSQEADIREETETWMTSFLFMAYAPLTDEELQDYTDFSRTGAAARLNSALFAAFDGVFTDVSFRLGKAVAPYVSGESL